MEDAVKRVQQEPERAAFKYANDIPGMFANAALPFAKPVAKSAGEMFTQPLAPWVRSTTSGGAPKLNDRAMGWLRHLHEKARGDDDWSYNSPGIHEWWDTHTLPPMCSWPRWDLQESSYAVALMADKTPAWREVYSEILDSFSSRYISHWGSADFINQFDDDPRRHEYSQIFRCMLPPDRFGTYDAPGYTGNGKNKFPDGSPAGYETDAVTAEGMTFYKGYLILLMAFHVRVSGDDKWLGEWDVAAVNDTTTRWTLGKVCEHFARQWRERECGLN